MTTILLIDAHQDFCEMVSYVLSNEGYKVVTAANLTQGLSEVQKASPDLVLIDVMPKEAGVGRDIEELLRADRIFSGVPVVFLTNSTMNTNSDGNAVIVDGHRFPFISKSVGKEELLKRVNACLLKDDRNVLRVLVVDDSPTDAHFIVHALKKSKYRLMEISRASSLAEAENILQQTPVDVLVLDLGLPDSPKAQTLQWMAKRELPVVVITGDEDNMTVGEVFRHGAQDYLVKGDFSEREVSRAVVYALERHSYRKQLHFYKNNIDRVVQDRLKEQLRKMGNK